MSHYTDQLVHQITRRAVDKLDVPDAMVLRQHIPLSSTYSEDVNACCGDWFCIFIRQTPLASWELFARRRTLAELLTLVDPSVHV